MSDRYVFCDRDEGRPVVQVEDIEAVHRAVLDACLAEGIDQIKAALVAERVLRAL